MSRNSSPITMMNTETHAVQRWPSVSAAAQELGCYACQLYQLRKGVGNTVKGWRIYDDETPVTQDVIDGASARLAVVSSVIEAEARKASEALAALSAMVSAEVGSEDLRADAKALAMLALRLVSQSGLDVTEEELELYSRYL